MAWIEVHQSLPSHRKTMRLATQLGIGTAQAVGHLTCLWLWSLDNAPEGHLEQCDGPVIARAAQWDGDAMEFCNGLVDSGFLDPSWNGTETDGYAIHDWMDYAGRLVMRRQEAASRKRQWRDGAARGRNADAAQDDLVTERGRNVDAAQDGLPTVPNRTQPYRTQPTVEKIHTVGVVTKPKPPRKRVARPQNIDDEFIALMVTEYGPLLGSERKARDAIERALNHTALDKAKNKRLYLRNWLKRDVEFRAERRNDHGQLGRGTDSTSDYAWFGPTQPAPD